jgi:hypothetical protein
MNGRLRTLLLSENMPLSRLIQGRENVERWGMGGMVEGGMSREQQNKSLNHFPLYTPFNLKKNYRCIEKYFEAFKNIFN